MSGRLLKGVFHPSLATCHTKLPNPYRPTNPSGYGLRWRLSLDQDPTTPTAQVGPGWGTQMHAMRPQLRTKGPIKSLPESRVKYPKPEEAGGRLKACSNLSCPPSPWMHEERTDREEAEGCKRGKARRLQGGAEGRTIHARATCGSSLPSPPPILN